MHEMIDEIQSRKGEKVAMFLTMQNASGLIIGAVPLFLITFRTLPWFLMLPLVVLGGAIGLLATLEMGGMAAYERALWLVRGILRQRLTGQRIAPEDLHGSQEVRIDRAIAIGGGVRVIDRPSAIPVQRTGRG